MRIFHSISAYAVLNGLLALRFWGEPIGWINLGLLVLAVISTVLILRRPRRTDEPSQYFVVEVADEASNAAGFLASLVLPFIFVNGTTWKDIAVFGVLYALLVYVSLTSGLYRINPTFALVRRRLYRAKLVFDPEKTATLATLKARQIDHFMILGKSSSSIGAGSRLRLVRLVADVYRDV